jgi:hypothetical protein
MAAQVVPNVKVRKRTNERSLRLLLGAVVIVGMLFNAAAGLLSLLQPGAFLSAVGEATLVSPAVSVFAEYAGARELAVAAALFVCGLTRATPALMGVLIVASAANALDTVGAIASGRWVQLPGALVFAIAYALAAAACWRLTLPSAASVLTRIVRDG